MDNLTDEKLVELSFDSNETDLRYAGGIVVLYSRMACLLNDLSFSEWQKFEKKTEAFMEECGDYHETNRWNFRPHVGWRKIAEFEHTDGLPI